MNTMTDILGVAALCVLLSRYFFPPMISFVYALDSRYRKTIKPFECGFCLSWWVGLTWFAVEFGLYGIIYGALCAIFGALIDRYL
jgi:hypothetical protein